MLYALGFVCMFTFGGMSGLFLATLGMDVHVHDTYFVVAHFHFIMVGGMVMAYMAGLHYWWPKITGRLYSDWWSRLTAMVIFVGFFLKRAAKLSANDAYAPPAVSMNVSDSNTTPSAYRRFAFSSAKLFHSPEPRTCVWK